jgi:hypothetical protein
VRLRTIGAAAAAVLAIGGLAGCKTNVGTAAVIDGHRVTESDVNQYLTANAQPIAQQDGTQLSPRSFVVTTLINQRLGFALLKVIPSISNTTEAQLDARLQRDLEGKSPAEVADQIGLHGYTADFARLYLQVRELIILVQQQPPNVRQDAFDKIDFDVSVSPRYGQWDNKQFSFQPGPRTPAYLDVQSASAAPGNS